MTTPNYIVLEFTSDLPQGLSKLPNLHKGQQIIHISYVKHHKYYLEGFGELSSVDYTAILLEKHRGNLSFKTVAKNGSDTPISKVNKQILKFYINQLPSYFLSIDDVKGLKQELGQEYLEKVKSDMLTTIANIEEYLF